MVLIIYPSEVLPLGCKIDTCSRGMLRRGKYLSQTVQRIDDERREPTEGEWTTDQVKRGDQTRGPSMLHASGPQSSQRSGQAERQGQGATQDAKDAMATPGVLAC